MFPDHRLNEPQTPRKFSQKVLRNLIFAVRDESAKTAKIMRLENLALYGNITCSLISGYDKITSPLILAESALGFGFRGRAMTEIKAWCIEGVHVLKIVSSEIKFRC